MDNGANKSHDTNCSMIQLTRNPLTSCTPVFFCILLGPILPLLFAVVVMAGGKRWEGHPQVFADILVRYVSKHSWFEYRDQVEPKKATKTRQELLRLRCLWQEHQKQQPNLLFNDKEVKQALERVLFEKNWFEAEADKKKAQSWTKDFSNWIRAALRDIRQSQLLSPNTAWLRKLWEHNTDHVAMLRQMNPEAKHQCKELKSPPLKEQFRREWSERRLAKHNEGRRTGSSWTEIDTSHGVYMNGAQLALDGGFLVDPEGSIERAKTTRFCTWETFSEHSEVLTAEELKSGVPLPCRNATSKEKIEDEVKPEGKPEGKPEATARPRLRRRGGPSDLQRQREFRCGWPAWSRAKAGAQAEPEESTAFEVACGARSGNGARFESRGDDQERWLHTKHQKQSAMSLGTHSRGEASGICRFFGKVYDGGIAGPGLPRLRC